MGQNRSCLRGVSGWFVLVSALALSGRVFAQWRAIALQPQGLRHSEIRAITPARQYGQAGETTPQYYSTPSTWSGSGATWAPFTDPTFGGEITGIAGDQIVGGDSSVGAAVWQGSPPVPTSLQQPSWWGAIALATSGQEQVGYYISAIGSPTRAVLWHGSAASATDLNPAGAFDSSATAAVPGLQGGYVRLGPASNPGGYRAALWSGSAASFENLNPAGAIESQILGMSPGQQVGWAQVPQHPGSATHAAMWSATAASFTDLNPSVAGVSSLNATCGTAQVGWANVYGSGVSAGIWFGTPESFISLGQYLPQGEYFQSVATCVATDGEYFYVGGYAARASDGQNEAFMWVGVPAPGSLALVVGAGVLAGRRRR